MVEMLFMRNAVLKHLDGTAHRLLSFEIEADQAWLIFLSGRTALPYSERYSELADTFVEQKANNEKPLRSKSIVETSLTALARAPSAARIALSDRAWARIEPLVDNPGLLDRHQRARLLREHANRSPANGTPKTLLKDLRAFWQGGQTQDALLGDYDKSGRPNETGTGRRGRKTKLEKRAYQLTARDLELMREVLETFYFDQKKKQKLTSTLQELHERHYTYVDGNNNSCLMPGDECPSYRQLDYFLKSTYPLEERLKKRKGEKRFAQENRSTEGSIQLDCHGVGHMYEFDATIADVILVSSKDRAAIVGKPTLYLIVDRASRLIVGWYAGFENASYTAAMEAILSLGQDKEALCRKLGIEYDPADWPAHGILPEMFLADQGELTSKKARRIARALRSMLSNVPGLRPDWKPLVECGFAMLHQIVGPHAPAYSPDAENRRRRGVNQDRYSALNLEEFTSLVVKAIITHNKTMQTGFPLSVSQVADEVPPIPRALWAHGVRRRMGKLDRMDFERVRAELMPRATATITEDGILFERMFYSCPEAKSRGWLVEGRRHRKPLEIAFDYRLVDEIIVYSPDGSGESFVASLAKDSVMFDGMAQADVKRHFIAVDELTTTAPEAKRQARYDYNQHAKKIAKTATAEMKEATQGQSRSSRKKDTAPARAVALASERSRLGGVARHPQRAAAAAPETKKQTLAPVIQLRPADPTVVATPPPPLKAQPADRPLGLKERMALARKQMEG